MSASSKSFKKESFFLVIIFLIFFGILEFLARFYNNQRVCHEPDVYQPDMVLGWIPKPGAQGRFDCFGTEILLNEQGHRGEEMDSNDVDFLFVGDSFLAGFEVDLEKTFARLLPKKTVNDGVRGYGTDQVLLKTRQILPKIHPKKVVYFFSPNDLSDVVFNSAAQGKKYQKPYFTWDDSTLQGPNFIEEPDVSSSESEMKRFLRQSALYQLLAAKYQQAFHRREKPLPPAYYQNPADETALVLVSELIKELKNTVEKSGAEFTMVYVPLREELDADYAVKLKESWANFSGEKRVEIRIPRIFFRGVCNLSQIHCLDPSDDFLAQFLKERKSFWFDHDPHLNENGHKAMTDFLVRHNL